MDDKKLVHGMKKKNEKFLMILIEQYSPFVCAIIKNVSKQFISDTDVEEIAADVFWKIWNNSDTLKAHTIRSYLAVITRNMAIDFLRKHKCEIPFDEIELLDNIDIEEETIRQIEKEELKTAIDELKPKSKELLLRFYFLFQSVSQIAKEMNMTETSCKTGLYRARQELKVIMCRKRFKDEN